MADLKQRIESCAARVATEEEQANTAKVRMTLRTPKASRTLAAISCHAHIHPLCHMVAPVPPVAITFGNQHLLQCQAVYCGHFKPLWMDSR